MQKELFFIFTFSFFLIQPSVRANENIELLDFYECDELFCPENKESVHSRSETSIADAALKNVGITKEKRRQVQLYNRANRISFQRVRTPPEGAGKSLEVTAQGEPEKLSDDLPTVQANHEVPLPAASRQERESQFYSKRGSSKGSSGGSGINSHGGRSGGANYSGIGRGNLSSVKGSRLRGSLKNTGGQNMDIRTGGGANSYTNPAFLNQQNKMGASKKDFNDPQKGGQAVKASLSGSSGGQLPGNSGSSVSQSKKPKSFLSKLAKRLGLGRYFGASGSQRSRSYGRRSYSYGKKGGRRSQARREEKLKTPSDILKERFNRYFKRGLANNLEFESPGTSIFQKMCEHYDNYTRDNNIPDNRRSCPR